MLRYRYPNQDWIEIDGDSWKTEVNNSSSGWKIVIDVDAVTTYYGGREDVTEVNGLSSSSLNGITGNLSTSSISLLSESENPDGDNRILGSLDYEQDGISQQRLYSFNLFRKSNGSQSNLTLRHMRPGGSGYRNPRNPQFASYDSNTGSWKYDSQFFVGCKFTVYKDESTVLERIEDDCPEVEVLDEKECPPNTCKVDCGEHYCCYNSQGISIESFEK